MTAAIKTVLFVDYDSLYLSLRARDAGMARRFASRPNVWIEAMKSGLLIAPTAEPAARRRILMRRIYADPKLLGKARPIFATQGFQIVDCPPLPGRERNSAEIQMVLDTIDALGHQTGFEEFILLSADSDLTPVIFRLRSYNRSTVIYASAMTPAGYRAVADGAIDEQALMAILAPTADAESPEADEPDEDGISVRAPGEREDLASLARRIHQLTNVPLFAPKVYAELFRALAHEIAENGYHFQATAENVASRLVAAGRNASRRQVAFVVKGLALKGHVFSVTDTPERLAEVFKEQVLYLARNAGMEVDDAVEMQVRAWVAGRAGGPEPVALPPPTPTKPVVAIEAPQPMTTGSTAKLTPIPSPPPMPGSGEPAAKPRPIILRASEPPMPQPIRPIPVRPAAPPAPPAAEMQPPAPVSPAPSPRPPVERRPAATVSPVTVQPTAANSDQPATPLRPVASARPPAPPAPEAVETTRPRTTISPPRPRTATRNPAGADVPSTAAPPAAPAAPPKSSAVTPVRPPARRSSPAPVAAEPPKDTDKDPIESSILAAIAEAVDVLVVEDGSSSPQAEAAPAPSPAASPTTAERAAPPPADDGDIGDEIQRILAAYSQNRKPGK